VLIIKRRIYWLIQEILWKLPKIIRRKLIGVIEQLQLTIGITTYVDRFENSFKPIIKILTLLFPYEQIIVVANGHFDEQRQRSYLTEIRAYCSKFSNVELFDFVSPVCCSKLVNTITLKTRNKKILLINDDLRFSINFKKFLVTSGILDERIAIINRSWCHLVLSKEIVKEVGFFDERLPEIGGEDDDFAARCALAGIEIPVYYTNKVSGRLRKNKKRNKLNSWGKDMTQQKGGYSSENAKFLLGKKWETSESPFEDAIFVPNRKPKYWKLREGMETPDFYPDLNNIRGDL